MGGHGDAFGAPGIRPTWTSSSKDAVVTALGPSRIWATIGHGIVNEVYWPSTGLPQIRDLGFIVAGNGWWREVKRAARYALTTPAPEVPLPRIVHQDDRYRLSIEVLPDPERDVLLISYELEGDSLRLYPLLAPHLSRSGTNNTAWVDGADLYAQRQDRALCLSSYPAFSRASAGFVGASDGWQDFARNGAMSWTFERAADGNVALMGELAAGEGVVALALAITPAGARTLARSSLAQGYRHVREGFVAQWSGWGKGLRIPMSEPELALAACRSAVVLRAHEDRTYPGAMVASLSIPWGTRGNDPGGYHLVWTRDLVQAALGLYVAGQAADCRRILAYLAARQEADGHWPQNFFPDGRGYWRAVQLDEVAWPVILAAALRAAGEHETAATRDMVRRAAGYIVRTGPLTQQDRWEENAGASPFTLASEIAALVAAVQYLEGSERDYALGLADHWNERIEEWTYARGTDLARRVGVDGHFVRIAAPPAEGGVDGELVVPNRDGRTVRARDMVGLEFAYLARLGLRDARDPRIESTLAVLEATLRRDTPSGPGYYRYNGDGYGEHADGSPYDGQGIGRLWPLLTGERGHLALLRGEDPLPYVRTILAMCGRYGLIPEQVWDGDAVPEHGLAPGRPSGSAMPLVWAHAELLRLLAARATGHPVEMLDVVRTRYAGGTARAATWYWRDEVPFDEMPQGRDLVIEGRAPFALRIATAGRDERACDAEPLGFGMFGVRLAASDLALAADVRFSRTDAGSAGADHVIRIARDP